jgi:hypothetical protein
MSCLIVDNTFGPHAYRCRGGLDFTLFFEETILTILPLALVLCISPFRILYLSKRSVKVNKGILLYVKWVSTNGLVATILYIHLLMFLLCQLAYLLYGVLCLTLVVLWSRPSAAMTRTRASIATAALSFLGQ